jgi:hypothetical protein
LTGIFLPLALVIHVARPFENLGGTIHQEKNPVEPLDF